LNSISARTGAGTSRDLDRRLDVRATGMLEESDQIRVMAGFRFSNVCPVAEGIQRPSM
jgi:hypothetical protein